MIHRKLVGGCVVAASFIILALVMSSLSSGGRGLQVMERMGMPYVVAFILAQLVVLFVFVKPAERIVPAMLFAGGTIVYMFVLGNKGDSGGSLVYALYAGSAFSGLAIGTFAVMGGE